MIAYVAGVSGHGIGDAMMQMPNDLAAQQSGIDLYWHVLCSKGWIHIKFFQIFNKAGFFTKMIVVPGLDHQNWKKEFLEYIERVYSKKYDDIQTAHLRRGYSPDEMRTRFNFLRDTHRKFSLPWNYITVHPTSGYRNKIKRMSFFKIEEHLEGRRDPIVILGSEQEQRINHQIKVKLERTNEVFDLTGLTDIEDYFGILYNSSYNIGCESNSSIFTAHLGIPSVIVFINRAKPNDGTISRMKYMESLEPLTVDTDVKECKDDSDLT